MSSVALSPVNSVDLPQSNVSAGVCIIVEGISVASRLVRDNAFAACLVPGIFAAPCGNILHALGGSTVAGGALS